MKDIITQLESGKSVRQMALELGMDRKKLIRQLVSYGYYEHLVLPEDHIQQAVVIDYKAKLNMDKIALKYHVSQYIVKAVLLKNNIRVNKKCEKNQFTVDHNYFYEINTEAKAYFLGLLFADGSVDKEKASIEITLKECDRYILETLKQELQTDFEIKTRIIKETPYVRFTFYSRQIFNDLERHGCIERKSLLLKFPNTIPNELIHHFIRGYFDGDGCISIYSRKRKTSKYSNYGMKFSMVGTDDFLIQCNDIFENEIGVSLHPEKNPNSGKAETYEVGGRLQLIRVFNYLYQNATVYLKRKYDIFIKVNMEPSMLVIA